MNQENKGTDRPSLPPLPISRSSYALQDHEEQNQHNARPRSSPEASRLRFLSPNEWAIFAHGVGGVGDEEHQTPVHAASYYWPPRRMPKGLYRDIVFRRVKFYYMFHVTSIFRWALMILQLFIGAALTALGTQSMRNGTPITVLGAANTIIAGLLAMVHNSGLPDRYRYNMAEFEQIEDHIREILDTGIVAADQTIDQVLAGCFNLFQDAKATVQANMPANYNSRKALHDDRQSAMMLSAGPQPVPRMSVGGEKVVTAASES